MREREIDHHFRRSDSAIRERETNRERERAKSPVPSDRLGDQIVQRSTSRSRRPPSGRTDILLVTTIFLIFLMIFVLTILFSVFKAKPLKVVVNDVQLPSFSISNGTVSFTFSQLVSVRNPNRAVFSNNSSTLQLLYSHNEVGFTAISAGKVGAHCTQNMAINLSVPSVAFVTTETLGPTREIVSQMVMAGRVRVLGLLTHHLEARVGCTISIAVGNGSVERFNC